MRVRLLGPAYVPHRAPTLVQGDDPDLEHIVGRAYDPVRIPVHVQIDGVLVDGRLHDLQTAATLDVGRVPLHVRAPVVGGEPLLEQVGVVQRVHNNVRERAWSLEQGVGPLRELLALGD